MGGFETFLEHQGARWLRMRQNQEQAGRVVERMPYTESRIGLQQDFFEQAQQPSDDGRGGSGPRQHTKGG